MNVVMSCVPVGDNFLERLRTDLYVHMILDLSIPEVLSEERDAKGWRD